MKPDRKTVSRQHSERETEIEKDVVEKTRATINLHKVAESLSMHLPEVPQSNIDGQFHRRTVTPDRRKVEYDS